MNIFEETEKGNLLYIKSNLKELNSKDKDGNNLLFYAGYGFIGKKNDLGVFVEIFNEILNNNVSLYEENKYNILPIMFFIEHKINDIFIFKNFIKYNFILSNNLSLLQYSISVNNISIAKEICSELCFEDLSFVNNYGLTALDFSIAYDIKEVENLLKEKGVPQTLFQSGINFIESYCENIKKVYASLVNAYKNNDTKLFSNILKENKYYLNYKPQNDDDILTIIIKNNSKNFFDIIFEYDYNYEKNPNLIHISADLPDLFIFMKLKAKINIKNFLCNGSNIFHTFAKRKLKTIENVKEFLLTFSKDELLMINTGDKNKETALMIAIKNHFADFVKHLLLYGANVNIQNKNNVTALHLAVIQNNVPLIKLLLKQNLITDVKDVLGKTPYDYALFFYFPEIIQILSQFNNHQSNFLNLIDEAVSKNIISSTTLKKGVGFVEIQENKKNETKLEK